MLWMPCRYNTFEGDCYGLMGLKGTWTDLNWLLLLLFVCVCVCVCVCVGGEGGGREG